MSKWFVYVVECRDGSLYCGISTNVDRRVYEHNNTKKGAKYTRSRKPVSLVFTSNSIENRAEASRLEAKFKKLNVIKKRELINDARKFNNHFNINRAPTRTKL